MSSLVEFEAFPINLETAAKVNLTVAFLFIFLLLNVFLLKWVVGIDRELWSLSGLTCCAC
uniref:Uncharacterized protein n=1 Tax=Anguilla anguilla TaxID=7936 RepID=A0A0E9QGA3_ANGAN